MAVGHVAPDLFNLVVREVATINGKQQVIANEVFRNLSMSSSDPMFVRDVINDALSGSTLIEITSVGTGGRPAQTSTDDVTASTVVGDANNASDPADPCAANTDVFRWLGCDGTAASDGTVPDATALNNGIPILDNIAPEVFNIMCIPAAANLYSSADDTAYSSVYATATTYCEDNRAFLIVDIPESVDTQGEMSTWMGSTGDNLRHENTAIYFPRLEMPDLLNDGRARNVAASGTMAGLYARTDSARGVWKAPAGTDANLRNAVIVTSLTDLQNGALNPFGVNVLRSFPIYGNVSWGGRTLAGADAMASEWKYIPVRRLALYIEESLYQGLKWVVFEPNDEPLWGQVRLNVTSFMQTLFRQGAFQGASPRQAYLVKCDSETTTQADINNGIVNIIVGFAPLKPAEFVVLKLQQLAGQTS